MTLKTSLIITGDASVARKEVADLTQKVAALAAGSRAAAGPVQQLDQAQAGTANAAREAAAAQQGLAQAVAQSAAKSTALVAANDQIAASSAAAASGAKVQAMAAEGLQSAIGAMVTQIAGGSTVFDAMATHGDAFAAALAEISGASTGAKASLAGVGSSGQAAGIDLAGLGDTVIDTAGKVEGMGGKLGSAAAILGGPWGAAIGIGINLLGGFVSGLIEARDSAEDAKAAAADLGRYVGDLGSYFNSTTGKIEETNRALIQFAVLSRQKKNDELREQQRTSAAAGAAARSESLRDLQPVFAERGLGRNAPQTINFDVRDALGSANRDGALRAIATSNSSNAALAERLLGERARFAQAAKEIAKNDAEIRSLLSGTLDPSLRSPASERAMASTAPHNARQVGAPSRARDTAADIAAKAASEAQAQLARDLDQVTARYLPATAAANEYVDALAQIDRLAKAFDPKKAGGLSPEDAERARAAAAATRDARLADLQRTPESQAADAARKSIDGVIAALGREAAARATLDPVQRAMIGHQAELAKLTGAERTGRAAALEGYYRQAEATRAIDEATRAAADAQRQFRDMALDAFDAIALGGENAGKVIDRLAQRIASAAIEAAVLGTGPLAALLKGGGKVAAGAAVPGAATAVAGVSTGQAAADVLGKSVGKSVGDRLDGLFGKGQSGKLLQNAGFGYTAASIVGGSGIAGGIGGALGGQLASKFLGSALGSLGGIAGPLGSIAGGLIGSVVGKLFTTVKSGSATIGSANGQSVVTGSTGNAAYRKASEGLASSVADSVDAIVAKLGGTLGSYAVSIGKKGDKYVVDNSGRGSTKYGKANDGITAYATAEEAQAAALANAIADGAVQGLSPKVAAAFRSTTNIDKALSEALKVQDLELTMAGITGTIDKAFRDLDTQAKERVRLATQYGFDLVAIEKKNGEDRAKLAEQLQKQQVGSLQKLIDEMAYGSLAAGTALDKLDALETAIGKARFDLANNVDGAGDVLADLLQRKVAASEDAYGTTGRYAADRASVLDEARAAVAASNARIAAAQTRSNTDPALATTNKALDENNDQNAEIISALKTNNDLLSQLIGRGTVGGSLTVNRAFSY